MASPGANIPISNTYAQALAPNITLPGVSLSGMPETVSLLQGSIPQIPTSGILNYNPIQISEAGWNPPRAGADILGFVKKYNDAKKKKETENIIIEGSQGTDMHAQHEAAQKKFYPNSQQAANQAGFWGPLALPWNEKYNAYKNAQKNYMEYVSKTGYTADQKFKSADWKAAFEDKTPQEINEITEDWY